MVTREHIDAAMRTIAGSDFLIVQNETNMDAITYALRLAHENGVKTLLNPAPAAPLEESLYAVIDYLTPNKTECETYTGVTIRGSAPLPACRDGAEWFLKKGAGSVCITLGEYGAYYYDGTTECLVPAFPVDAVDTTAAGDCFNAGFAVGLAGGQPVAEALKLANACGALAATKKGALPSISTKEEIFHFLDFEDDERNGHE
jgi:ribokinase